MDILALFSSPATWVALLTLVTLEIVLGIDNLVFISLISNKLPVEQQSKVRKLGIGLALVLRLLLLLSIAWLVGLTAPVIDLGVTGPPGQHGEPTFETALSWRDLILIAGGLFLVWKATSEIGHTMDANLEEGGPGHAATGIVEKATVTMGGAIVQILALDLVFSIDSILTAVGMTGEVPIMIAAVVIAVGVMLLAADPLAAFIGRNPSVVMLALAFLLMIGLVLIADGFGAHVPKGYIYAAMGFSVGVEALNLWKRRRAAAKH